MCLKRGDWPQSHLWHIWPQRCTCSLRYHVISVGYPQCAHHNKVHNPHLPGKTTECYQKAKPTWRSVLYLYIINNLILKSLGKRKESCSFYLLQTECYNKMKRQNAIGNKDWSIPWSRVQDLQHWLCDIPILVKELSVLVLPLVH